MKQNGLTYQLILICLFILAGCKKDEIVTEEKLSTQDLDKEMSISAVTNSTTGFILGINGHPLTQKAYFSVTPYSQANTLKGMDMKFYRIDVNTDADGTMWGADRFLTLQSALKSQNIEMLPQINLKHLSLEISETTAYWKGRVLGEGFSRRYGKYFSYYELGNQQGTKLITSGDGSLASNYDYKKVRVLAAYLKGIDNGLKKVDKDAKTIVNTTWKHYGYLKMIQDLNVKFDIVGYNWYSNMGNGFDIMNTASNLVKKPVWVTSITFKNGSYNSTEAQQSEYLNNFITECTKKPAIKAVFINELFDQPELTSAPVTERYHGVIKWESTYTKFEYKTIGKLLLNQKANISSSNFYNTNLVTGITGHPLNQHAYMNTPANTQIQLLKDMKMSYYRIDISTHADGTIWNTKKFDELRIAASNGGIKLLPTLFLNGLSYKQTESEAFRVGKSLTYGFAKKYGQYFDVYELGNEEESKIILSKSYDGDSPSHYDATKMKILTAFLKGMDQGIKEGDEGSKTIINAGWKHYSYLKGLEAAGVNYDIVGYHWYSDMDGVDPFVMLKDVFTKPVWFTEIGKKHGTADGDEASQAKWTMDFIEKSKKYSFVKAVMLYELFDQPTLITPFIGERHYGVYKWESPHTRFTKKTLAYNLTK